MINYDTIKQLAADNGIRITDLLALAPANDPFYTGRPAEIAAAEWFTELWQQFGYGRGVHLRRIHYQIVSQNPPVKMTNGAPYENTQACWDHLNNAAKWARYLDMVPAALFVDRRNPEAIINRRFHGPDDWDYTDPTPRYRTENHDGDWLELYRVPPIPELPQLPDALPDAPFFEVDGYEGIQQPYLVEVWAEKTTMNDVLIPLCERYGVNLVTGAGELSITAVIQFMQRVQASGLPARILYVSDFDPAGLGMPISVARKIEYYQRWNEFEVGEIALQPIVLTPEQIDAYELPRVPVKSSDLRKENFEAAYGIGQVELDALEALHPGELLRIVEDALMAYYDPTLYRRAAGTRHQLQRELNEIQNIVLEYFGDDITALGETYADIRAAYASTCAAFDTLVADFQQQLDAYDRRMADLRADGIELYLRLESELETRAMWNLDIDEYPLPEADLLPEPEPLYHSARGYIEQLRHYQALRNNTQEVNL